MKFSKKWLDLFLENPPTTDELVKVLNRAGLEVDSVEPASVAISGVKVAYVESAEKHPDADKLNVVQVRVAEGGELLQVVCGASNVRAGLKVAFATVGSVIGEDFKIKKAKLRGVESNGMICSASELGLAEESQGIIELPEDAPIGEDINTYFSLPDDVIEVDLTPNRADCLSVQGIARDVAAVLRTSFKEKALPVVNAVHPDVLPVKIESENNCLRYCGRVVKGIDLSKSTPVWMSERLRRSGIRCINPVVDVTNYVLLELGQPMHAFDLAKIKGGIVVRQNKGEETFALLDDSTVKTHVDTMLIADHEKPLALAGIMGGLDSSVTDSTVDIFFESAAFAPNALAGKARAYGLHTDSSHRFERGVSPMLAGQAIEYATALLLEITGGEPGPVIDEVSSQFTRETKRVSLRKQSVKRLLGVEIDNEVIETILSGLGLNPSFDNDTWQVEVPPFRFDINIEADLIEEIARLYGYDNIASHLPRGTLKGKPVPEAVTAKDKVLEHMKALGYSEIIAYSFVDPKVHRHFVPEDKVRRLVNPISEDLSEMRVSLIPGLLQAVKYNQSRQVMNNRFFESGLTFIVNGEGLLTQKTMLAAVLAGDIGTDDWSQGNRKVDFFDLKGDLEHLLSSTGKTYSFVKTQSAILHPGQGAEILDDTGRVVGSIGLLHPVVVKGLGLKGSVIVFEIEHNVFNEGAIPRYQTISKFPHIRRDLALIVDESIEVTKMLASIASNSGDHFDECFVFDLYQGPGIAEGKKSIAFGINLKSIDKTFTDSEINEIMERILHALKSDYGAELREQ